jgi:hypothetical protein
LKPNFGKARLVAACVLALPALVFAIPGYGPFLPADRVRSVLLIEGIEKADKKNDKSSSSSSWIVKIAEGRWAAIEVQGAGEGKAAKLTLMPGGDGQPRSWDIPESAEAPVLITGFYAAELNGDNVPDFIVTRSYLGCGLAADITQVLLFLSKPGEGHVLVANDTYDWGPDDIVELGGDGKLRWVETKLEQTEDSKGRPQSYWVHTLWRVDAQEVVRERELRRVRYSSNPTLVN